jgi:predicted cupin superfamily sugar epimerase
VTANDLIRLLGLEPHPHEGGWFAETYRSRDTISGPSSRALSTAIYYLLTPETFSALHRLGSDEIYHFYLGDAVTMLILSQGGESRVITLGSDVGAGQRLQALVPAGAWQGACLEQGGAFALMGTTMAPGWDPRDFELAARGALLESHPRRRELIKRLTPP